MANYRHIVCIYGESDVDVTLLLGRIKRILDSYSQLEAQLYPNEYVVAKFKPHNSEGAAFRFRPYMQSGRWQLEIALVNEDTTFVLNSVQAYLQNAYIDITELEGDGLMFGLEVGDGTQGWMAGSHTTTCGAFIDSDENLTVASDFGNLYVCEKTNLYTIVTTANAFSRYSSSSNAIQLVNVFNNVDKFYNSVKFVTIGSKLNYKGNVQLISVGNKRFYDWRVDNVSGTNIQMSVALECTDKIN